MSTSSSIGSIQGSPWDGWIGTMNFCPFPFSFILSLSKDINTFIFLPQVRPTKAGKELDPRLRVNNFKVNFGQYSFYCCIDISPNSDRFD